MHHKELLKLYETRKNEIKQRLKDFKEVMNFSDEQIFAELTFCLFTPQSKAKTCDLAVKRLVESNMLLKGDQKQIERYLEGVRFPANKAKYLVESRKFFMTENGVRIKNHLKSFHSSHQARDWLVKNIKGFGYKEASHFLRNIGLVEDLAILDKHILKNLHEFGVINEIPKSITPKKYFEIENRMKRFAREIGIPFAELDLLLWSKETGEIFK